MGKIERIYRVFTLLGFSAETLDKVPIERLEAAYDKLMAELEKELTFG